MDADTNPTQPGLPRIQSGIRTPARAHRELLQALTSGAPFAQVACIAAGWAQTILKADGATVSSVQGELLEYVAAVGSVESLIGKTTGRGASFTHDALTRLETSVYDPRLAAPESRARAERHGVEAGLVTPISVEGRALGTIGVCSRHRRIFDESDREQLERLADYLGLAMQRTQLVSQLAHANQLINLGALIATLSAELADPLDEAVDDLQSIGELDGEAGAALQRAQTRLDDIASLLADVRRSSQLGRPGSAPATESPLRTEILAALGIAGARARRVAKLVVNLPQDLPSPGGAASRIAQVILNLVNNATDAIAGAAARENGDRRPDEIRIDAVADRRGIEISVSDTGDGIQPAIMPKVFEPFFTTKPAEKAAGLGLSLARRIVHDHGGHISITSSIGSGTTVTIRLPRE